MRRILKFTLLGLIIIHLIGYSALGTFLFLSKLAIDPSSIQKDNILKTLAKNSPKAYIVQSGSMEPTIKTGSVVVASPRQNYIPGDVVSFSRSGDKKNVITHRIALIKPVAEGTEPIYQTMGDANKTLDPTEIKQSDIIGKVNITLPYLGYLANFAKTPKGFLLMVIVPATIIIYEELKSLRREMGKVFSKVKPFGKFKKRRSDEGTNEKGIPKILMSIPIFGAVLIFIAFSGSFFVDNEVSMGNSFTAYTPTGTPSPTPNPIAKTLVINEILWKSSCTNPEDKYYIELWNGSDQNIDIQQWSFKDATNTIIQIQNANKTLAPGETALIVKSSSVWNSNCYGKELSDVTANLGGNVNFGTSGTIKLIDSSGNVVDRVDYGTGNLNPANNQSIERRDRGYDTLLNDFFESADFVVRNYTTPGFGFSETTPIIINELLPNPSSGDDWVEIMNRSSGSLILAGYLFEDAAGNILSIPTVTLSAGEHRAYDWSNRLNNDGDKIYLRNGSNSIVDGLSYYKQVPTPSYSIGRYPDGNNTYQTFSSPTKGGTNI